MNKLWLIIQREYLTRVKTPSFILTTLLTPLGLLLFMVVVTIIFSYESDNQRIAVKDDYGLFNGRGFKDDERSSFFIKNSADLDALKSDENYDAVLQRANY